MQAGTYSSLSLFSYGKAKAIFCLGFAIFFMGAGAGCGRGGDAGCGCGKRAGRGAWCVVRGGDDVGAGAGRRCGGGVAREKCGDVAGKVWGAGAEKVRG